MPVKVLIVDDDPLVLAGLGFMLTADTQVTIVGSAGSGPEALELARVHQPDVALVDLRMPGMNGIEVTTALRATPHPPEVLILTTFDADENVLAALEKGAAGFLLKDIPPVELMQAIHDAAGGKAVLSPTHTRLLVNRYTQMDTSSGTMARARLTALSDREREVVDLVTAGLSNAEIAERLHCSISTIKAHLAHVYTQLDVSTRVQLAILGYQAQQPQARP